MRGPGRKRIALVMPSLGNTGGAERSVLLTAGGLVARGFDVDVVSFDDANAYPDDVPAEARLVRLRPRTRRRDWPRIAWRFGPRLGAVEVLRMVRDGTADRARAIASYIDGARPDAVLPSLPGAKPAAVVAAFLARHTPVLVPIVHSVPANRSPRDRRRYAALLPDADRVVAVSRGVAAALVRDLALAPARIVAIRNPVYHPGVDERARRDPGCPWLRAGQPPVVLAAGRLAPVKDFATLLRAFARVRARRRVRLVILGRGRERRRLEELAAALGVRGDVALPGFVANPYAYMARAGAFVLTSRHEGLGNVVIEALACGCPTASTDCEGGPREILAGGRFGPLVPVGDDEALAAAIERLLDAPPDAARLRERGRAFSVDAAADRYRDLLATLLAAPVRGPVPPDDAACCVDG